MISFISIFAFASSRIMLLFKHMVFDRRQLGAAAFSKSEGKLKGKSGGAELRDSNNESFFSFSPFAI
jgi:hypothetical protein